MKGVLVVKFPLPTENTEEQLNATSKQVSDFFENQIGHLPEITTSVEA